jgi:hypothetical protein
MRFGASVHILILAALAILSAYGCSPRSQPGSSGNNVILFDDKSGALRGNETTIRTALTSTLITVSKALPITDVTITVMPDPQRTISGYGVGAYTPDANTVRIYVDPTFASSAVLPQHLALTLAHELHHTVRWKGPGYGHTLFQAMITEGLADRFCIEVLGAAYVLPPWDNVFPPERTATFSIWPGPSLTTGPTIMINGSLEPTRRCRAGLVIPWDFGSSKTTKPGTQV